MSTAYSRITWSGIREFPLRFHAKRILGCSFRDYGLWIVRARSYIIINAESIWTKKHEDTNAMNVEYA